MSDIDRSQETDRFISGSLGAKDSVTGEQLSQIDSIVSKYLRNKPTLDSTNVFGAGVTQGLSPGPCIFLGEISSVDSQASDRIADMEYLMTLIAREGDVMLLSGARNHEFEKYRKEELQLGDIKIIETNGHALSQLNSKTPASSLQQLIDYLQNTFTTESINIVPFYGSPAVWGLASYIAEQTGLYISVAAPAPKLSSLVNDRLWFRDLARSVLGPDDIPVTRPVYGPESLVQLMRVFATRYSNVVVRIPNGIDIYCNVKMDSQKVTSSTDAELTSLVTSVLKDHDWDNKYPLLVEVWDTEIFSSPTVQVWVPLKGTGSPIVEGIYDRSLLSVTDRLVIAQPADIPPPVKQVVITESIQLAYALQQLGYYSKLELEGVFSGTDSVKSHLHWTGCNGRWSGLTLPVALSNRLFDTEKNIVSIAQLTLKDTANSCFSIVHAALHDLLFTTSNREARVLLPIPGGSSQTTQFITVGHDSAQVETLAREVAVRLSRLGELRLDPMLT